MNSKIVVVGAGLAGMTAAYRLFQKGLDVEVYEARGRVGGRTFSAYLNGQAIEFGGQNIYDGGEAKHIHALIDELGLETEESQVPLHLFYFNGSEIVDPQLILKKYQFEHDQIEMKLSKALLNAKNMKDVLDELFHDDPLLHQTVSVMLSAYEGADPIHLSIKYIDTLSHILIGGLSSAHQSHGERETLIDFKCVKNGNGRIAQMIAEKLGHRIHLKSSLKAISRNRDGSYLLGFVTGEQIQADQVILTIPCSVYEDIHFGEGVIPQERLDLIKKISYGTNSKIILPIETPSETKGQFTNGRAIIFYPNRDNILTLYYIGEQGKLTSQSLQDTFSKEMPLIDRIYKPKTLEAPTMAADSAFESYTGPVAYSWPHDPYAKGSYSYIAPGFETAMTSLENNGNEQVKSLFVPVDHRLFFAGEHASILLDVAGTMEAAVESGERTARMIIENRKAK